MKPTPLFLLSALTLAAASCNSITGESTTVAKTQQGVPGGEVVETTKVTATVTGIDSAKRKITLVTPDGKKSTVKAGPEVVNFDQIKIGDQFKATLTEDIVIRMAKPGEKSKDEAAAMVGIAPVGAKPGMMMADTVQVTATVSAINLKKHKATLQFPDGSTKQFAVRNDVDLSQRKVGEKVVIRSTETFVVLLEKP